MRLIETGAILLCLVLVCLILFRKKISFLIHWICATYGLNAKNIQFKACMVCVLGYFLAYRLRANQSKPIENKNNEHRYSLKVHATHGTPSKASNVSQC